MASFKGFGDDVLEKRDNNNDSDDDDFDDGTEEQPEVAAIKKYQESTANMNFVVNVVIIIIGLIPTVGEEAKCSCRQQGQ